MASSRRSPGSGHGVGVMSLWLTDYYYTRCRARWFHSRRRVWAQVGVRRRLSTLLCFLSWWSVVVLSWGWLGPCRMLGSLLFWHRSRAMSVLDDVMLFMFLIDVASVSQLCSPLYYSYHMGCCNDCLTCDIAFNAVMSLSCASTRGSYSRIEGVTGTK